MRRRTLAVAAVAGSLLVGGATGAALFGPALAGAQTTTTTPENSGSVFKSNEDQAHEANETPEQEAAEHAGTGAGRTAPSTVAPSSAAAGSATKTVFRS